MYTVVVEYSTVLIVEKYQFKTELAATVDTRGEFNSIDENKIDFFLNEYLVISNLLSGFQ